MGPPEEEQDDFDFPKDGWLHVAVILAPPVAAIVVFVILAMKVLS